MSNRYVVDIRVYWLSDDGDCDEVGSGGEPPNGWENVAEFEGEDEATRFADGLHKAGRRMRRDGRRSAPETPEGRGNSDRGQSPAIP